MARSADLSREIAFADGYTRSPWRSGIASALTPRRLGAIFRAADQGSPEDFFILADEIEERDAHYSSVLSTRKHAVAELRVSVEAPTDGPEDERIADFIRELVRATDFRGLLFDLLDALAKGFSVIEILWHYEADRWLPEKFLWRNQRFFILDQKNGVDILLRDRDAREGVPLVENKFIVHRPKLRSGNLIRSALARTAAIGYLAKSFALKDWVVFLESYGTPVRIGKYEPGATDAQKKELYDAIISIGTDAACVLPSNLAIDFLTTPSPSSNGELYERLCTYVDAQISKLVLGQTMAVDSGSSWAQAFVHDGVRRTIIASDARQIEDTLARDLVRPVVDLNFGPRAAYPRIVLLSENSGDLVEFTNALTPWVDRGLAVEASVIRDRFGLPAPAQNAEIIAPQKNVSANPFQFSRKKEVFTKESREEEDEIDRLAEKRAKRWREDIGPIVDQLREIAREAVESGDFLRRIKEIRFDRFTEGLAIELLKARVLGLAGYREESFAAKSPMLPGKTKKDSAPIPKEAIAYFESKKIEIAGLEKIWTEEHAYAFTLSRIASKELIADVHASLAQALRSGETFASWKKRIKEVLDEKGWTAYDESVKILVPSRLRTIYDTNLRVARAAGAWQRIEDTKEILPYLEYCLGPSRSHRELHESWSGTILPVDHEWWRTHYPPNGFGCRCWVRQLSEEEAMARGISSEPPEGEADEGFGTNPGLVRAAEIRKLLKEAGD